MQINRLFEIVYSLLDHKTMTAKSLAEKFEVSTRTIYRDVEVLSGAGVPIYMSQGKGGGIRLMENYILDKTVLSQGEQEEILSALQGLRATSNSDGNDLLSKLSVMFQRDSEQWIAVDFSSWSDQEPDKFDKLKCAIQSKRAIRFDYFGRYGDKSKRCVYPLLLWFKDKSWYLRAFCKEKKELRVFKLTRMKQIQITEEQFDKGEYECQIMYDEHTKVNSTPIQKIVLWIHASQAYRVYDEFSENQVVKNSDESFTVTMKFPEDEWVYGYILSYGCYAKVLEPVHLQHMIEKRLIKALEVYEPK